MTTEKKSIYKPRPVSGFPEWLPEVRLVEQQWMDHIRRVFESYGFCSVETPSVEELDVLRAKGEVDKEIYVIERLHKEEGDKDEARLALHFDQTVPLARYVAQHFNDLVFPFKRYQMQRVWRGERPQAGRFREFYQCDIDVINVDNLPLHFDAEMPAIIWEILSALPGMENEKIQLQISNRKILLGLLAHLEIAKPEDVTRTIDKLEKIGKDSVTKILSAECGLDDKQIKTILDLATATDLNKVTAQGDMMTEGLNELRFVMQQLAHLPPGAVKADLSIVRGLDYYTGTVYETRFIDDPTYGSICSGGRYEDLAGSYIRKKLPGVGISIGFSRLFDRLRVQNKLPVSAKSPADIMMVLPSEEQRVATAAAAHTLRQRGFKVEMYHAARKIDDQLKYANKKNIPFVWFPPFEAGGKHEVKDMIGGKQMQADPETWTKPEPESKNAAVA
ncbi:MAG: histidine--tRNA ligase [Alphaproteobacteria bacterium]|nr:histidine--tRNA ligase [Alphaproteobacteria bacterium]